MNVSMIQKLQTLSERHIEIGRLLSDPDIMAQQEKFIGLSKEFAELEPLVKVFHQYQEILDNIKTSKELLQDPDPQMQSMAKEELSDLEKAQGQCEHDLKILLLPKDPDDDKNVFLEIRAGTGGDEAAIFVGDLFRMYSRFCENKGWKVEIISENPSEQGGFKEIILKVMGDQVYSNLKFESGAHRVQRVPVTESQGRVHTSACTVAIMPEVEGVEEVDINSQDLRVDTYRASGAGGQHVNKTDSAVRLTHIPTGIVAECQEERSQHKNKAKAMSLLRSKILQGQREAQMQEESDARRKLVGSGDRSERIRTYNFPQGRVTDHRINLTLYRLTEVIEGDLNPVIEPLRQEYQAEELAEFSD